MTHYDELLYRINLLEYHQRLLLKLLTNPKLEFYKLVVEEGVSEREVRAFFHLCGELNIKMERQKAEGFVNFHPLFNEFSSFLPTKFDVKEVVQACLKQQLYVSLFTEFNKHL